MPDKTLDQLTTTTTPSPDALVYILDNPTTTPADRGITLRTLVGGGGGSSTLTANRTYYVRTDGNDANTGLSDTAGGAFLTIQHAIDVVHTSVNLGGYDVVIQVRDGTYAGFSVESPFVGNGTVTVLGNTSDRAQVIINSTVSCTGGRVYLQYVYLNGASTYGLYASDFGAIYFDYIRFGSTGTYHMYATDSGLLVNGYGYQVSASATYHLYLSTGGIARTKAGTIIGAIAFTTAYYIGGGCLLVLAGRLIGSATGQAYSNGGSFLDWGGFPAPWNYSDSNWVPNTVTSVNVGAMTGKGISRDYLLADETRTSTTTLTETSLGAYVHALTKFKFKARLYTTSNVAGGVKFSLDAGLFVPADPAAVTTSAFISAALVYSGGTVTQTRGTAYPFTFAAVTAVTAAYIEVEGVATTTNGGLFSIFFAQNASSASASTLLAGSWLEVDIL